MNSHLKASLAEFATALWEPGDLIELRALRRGGAQSRFCYAGELTNEMTIEFITRLNATDWNIYAGAHPRKRKGGTGEDVALARCLFADIERIEPHETVRLAEERGLPLPTLVICSGRGTHLWWRLDSVIEDLSLFTGYQKRIIATLGSDPCVHDWPRVMRVPGTMNVKYAPVPCEISGGTRAPVSLLGFGEPVRSPQYLAPAAPASADWHRNLCRATRRFLVSGALEGVRNATVFAAACDVAGNGGTFDETVALLLHPSRRSGLEDWETESAIRSALSKPRTPTRPPAVPPPPTGIGVAWDYHPSAASVGNLEQEHQIGT